MIRISHVWLSMTSERKLTWKVVSAAALLVAPAQIILADPIDLASMKCESFLGLEVGASSNIMLWLLGYYTYPEDPAQIDMVKEKAQEGQVKQYCADHKELPLLDAAEIFMDKKYGSKD